MPDPTTPRPFFLRGASVLTAAGLQRGVGVQVRGTQIVALAAAPTAHADVVDLDGGVLVPGFIDVQVNGGGGVLFNDAPTVATIERIASAHRRFGTTGLLPTLITDGWHAVERALDAVDAAIAAGTPGVLGLHLEGPFLNPRRKGVHDAGHMRSPDESMLARLCAPRRGALVVTLAPEQVARGVVHRLAAAGVLVCAGHSDATYEQARQALDEGLRGFTHLYNAMSPLASRAPGVVGAALEDRASWCGLIVDGHHVHPASLRVAIAAKTPERCLLVTDAMAGVGTDETSWQLQGRRIVRDGTRITDEHGTLAGSALDMATAVRNAVHMLDLPLETAVRMASLHPAQFLRLERITGTIAPGLRADLVHLGDDLQVLRTWIGGA